MQILDVLIEYGISSLDRTFSYAYQGEIKIKPGIRVLVNFNHKEIVGYVVNVKEIDMDLKEYQKESLFVVKEITKVIDEEPLLNDELVKLAHDMKEYYFAPLMSIYQAMLPPSLKPKRSSLSKPKISYDTFVICKDENEEDLTPKQIETLRLIKNYKKILRSELKPHLVKALFEKNKIDFVLEEKIRLVQEEVSKKDDLVLSDEQKRALDSITEEGHSTYLLEGVTGSGKTEVYLQASRRIIEQGKTVLMLVPEISLTHQMVKRFKERFDNIAILHSSLTPSEKYDEYRLISQGKVNIVVGARSAIFAPLKNIGLVIIDEEHVETYKQETTPYYHALKVALMRQKYHKFKLVLGSATPSLETKTRALKGIYHQLYLTKRINDSSLPKTTIVNMLDLNNIDNDSIMFSKTLREKIQDRLDKKEQTMLLINKRGYAPYIQCSRCQMTLKCPTCGVILSYHQFDDMLKCHHCGYVSKMPSSCPKCSHSKFYKIGFGSEKVEEEIKRLYPSARVARLDSDVALVKNKVKDTLTKFENNEIDILIGTQMIAKGHDFRNVTLVGVVLADLGLNIPSYKSSERTFNLITQAIGRSGRVDKLGEAIIQTYNPNHYVIYDSSIQDYNRFFNEEMTYRKESQNPPYVYLAMITLASEDLNNLIDTSFYLKNHLEAKFANKKVEVIGPSEPFLAKVNNKYQRKILIKFKKREDIENEIKELIEIVNNRKKIQILVNIDPESDY